VCNFLSHCISALLGLTFFSFPFLFFVHRIAEFILHKLKEMEKITEDDIALLKEEFKNLDVDKSNSLTAHDINSNREVTLSM
jgi:hypothetical protein